MLGGAGVAIASDGELLLGGALLVAGVGFVLPFFYAREVVLEADAVVVSAGLPGLARTTRHPRGAFEKVRWTMTRPKPTTAGSSNAKSFAFELVGPDAVVALPVPSSPDVAAARTLGASLGLPVEREVDGEVVERWAADGTRTR